MENREIDAKYVPLYSTIPDAYLRDYLRHNIYLHPPYCCISLNFGNFNSFTVLLANVIFIFHQTRYRAAVLRSTIRRCHIHGI